MKKHPFCADRESTLTPFDLPLPAGLKREWAAIETRRRFFGRSGKVLGWAALAALFGKDVLGKSAAGMSALAEAADPASDPQQVTKKQDGALGEY
jgi:hypothetical protein